VMLASTLIVPIKIIAFFLITIHIEASGVGRSCGK
jgi:hypothetical protein